MTKITLARHHIVVAQAQFKSSPSQVYAIWTDTANRHRWEPTPEGMKTHYLNYDFRIGGVEQSEMRQGGAVVAKFIMRFLICDHNISKVGDEPVGIFIFNSNLVISVPDVGL